MADNVELDPGTGGALVATDDAGLAGHVQINKLAISADGSATPIPADATNGLDVDVTRLPSLPAGANSIGTVEIGATSLAALETTELGATTLAALESITIGTALPAGTNAIGKLAANAGVEIGDVGLNAASLAALESITVVNGGTFATQETGAGLTALQLLDDSIVADDAAFTVATTKVNMAGFLADQASTDSVNEGDAGAARMTLDRKQIVTLAPSADTEGLLVSTLVSAASTNATSVKASAGKLYGWYIYNDGAAEVYFKFYNKASAPTVGTDVPVMTLGIPAGGGANQEFGNGIAAFPTGIAFAVTTGATTADTGAVALSQVVSNLLYQ